MTVADTWQLFLRTCDNDLVVTIRDKRPPKQQHGEDYARAAESATMSTADVSIDVCLCFLDEPDMDIVSWPCCNQLMHRDCLLVYREFNSLCCYCASNIDDMKTIQSYPSIDRSKEIPKTPELTPKMRSFNWSSKRTLQEIELDKVFGTPMYDRLADKERAVSQEKRRERQLAQANDMIRTRGKAIVNDGVLPGSVLTVYPDFREVSHGVGIVAIVYKTSPGGGVLAATEYGLLTHSDNKKHFYIPDDRYTLRYKQDEEAPLSLALQRVRESILNKTYDDSTVKKVTIQEAHKLITGQVSPQRRGKCNCLAQGCKNKRCPCIKKGLKCISACKCNMNCCNPENGK